MDVCKDLFSQKDLEIVNRIIKIDVIKATWSQKMCFLERI